MYFCHIGTNSENKKGGIIWASSNQDVLCSKTLWNKIILHRLFLDRDPIHDFHACCRLGNNECSGASFVLGSTLKRPFTRKRPAHEERRIIPLAVHHRTAMLDVCFAVTPQLLLPHGVSRLSAGFLGYDRRSAGLGPRCKGGLRRSGVDCARL